MIATIQPPASVKAWMGFNVYGTILISLLVLGLILLLLGFFVDYARARPNRSGETTTKSSTWASLLKNAAMLKIAGSFCLISSVTVASFKFEKLIGIEMQESPIELHVGLQHLVSEIVVVPTKTKIVEEPPAPPPSLRHLTTPGLRKRRYERPMLIVARRQIPDKFVLKTFTLGKEDEFDGMDRQVTQETVATRLNEILNDIAAGAKARDIAGPCIRRFGGQAYAREDNARALLEQFNAGQEACRICSRRQWRSSLKRE